MSPLMSSGGSRALLGNIERPIFELQYLVTIVVLVLSLYETWLIARVYSVFKFNTPHLRDVIYDCSLRLDKVSGGILFSDGFFC